MFSNWHFLPCLLLKAELSKQIQKITTQNSRYILSDVLKMNVWRRDWKMHFAWNQVLFFSLCQIYITLSRNLPSVKENISKAATIVCDRNRPLLLKYFTFDISVYIGLNMFLKCACLNAIRKKKLLETRHLRKCIRDRKSIKKYSVNEIFKIVVMPMIENMPTYHPNLSRGNIFCYLFKKKIITNERIFFHHAMTMFLFSDISIRSFSVLFLKIMSLCNFLSFPDVNKFRLFVVFSNLSSYSSSLYLL